jgi:hypothetical protein
MYSIAKLLDFVSFLILNIHITNQKSTTTPYKIRKIITHRSSFSQNTINAARSKCLLVRDSSITVTAHLSTLLSSFISSYFMWKAATAKHHKLRSPQLHPFRCTFWKNFNRILPRITLKLPRGPMTKTATTLSQSLGLNLAGLSTMRYGTLWPFLCLWINTSLSRFAPSAFFCSTDTNLKQSEWRKKNRTIQGVFEMRVQILTTCYWLHVELGKNI